MLEVDPVESSFESFPRIPPVRALRREFDIETIDIIEFLQIQRCELQHLVADRNSVLGKLAEPSQRLVYEIEFLREAKACLGQIRQDYPELSARLAGVVKQKEAKLPAVIWQATLGGSEFRRFWQTGNDPLPARFDADGSVVLVIRQVTEDASRWLSGDYEIDGDLLEERLQTIREGRGGEQLKAWQVLAAGLSDATAVLKARLADRPLCYEGMRTQDADIFGNVVQRWFIRDIQAWAARLSRRSYDLFSPVRGLEQLLSAVEPAPYRQWRAERDAWILAARDSVTQHVDALAPPMDQCGLMPASSRSVEEETTNGSSQNRD